MSLARRSAALLLPLLLVSGCTEFDTSYGSLRGQMINGFEALYQILDKELPLRSSRYRRASVHEADLLIYAERPDLRIDTAESHDYLQNWLTAQPGRQALLLLAGGDLTTYLTQRWARTAATDEERQGWEAYTTDSTDAIGLDQWPWFQRPLPLGIIETAFALAPDGPLPVPEFFIASHGLQATAEYPFIHILSIDGRVQIARITVENSSLLVVANSQPFLNAGLVEPAARQWLTLLLSHLHAPAIEDACWLEHLSEPPAEAPQPGILAHLFGRPPISLVVWHLLALMLFYLWYRSRHFGPRRTDEGLQARDFDRHLQALGYRLAASGGRDQILAQLAERAGAPAPPPCPDDRSACHHARRLLAGGAAAQERKP